MEIQDDRVASRLRANADNLKLIATFAGGIAGTLVATALQVGSPNAQDLWATRVMGFALFLTLAVLFSDRQREADEGEVLRASLNEQWSPNELLRELRKANHTAQIFNKQIVEDLMTNVLLLQVLASAAAGILACWSLLAEA